MGNQAISSYYPYSASIGSATGYGYWFDKEFSPGVAQTQLANPDITWEKSHQFDIGVDYAFLKNRLSGSFDYYVRNIDDMLNTTRALDGQDEKQRLGILDRMARQNWQR